MFDLVDSPPQKKNFFLLSLISDILLHITFYYFPNFGIYFKFFLNAFVTIMTAACPTLIPCKYPPVFVFVWHCFSPLIIDAEGIPRGAQRRRVYAPSPRNSPAAYLRKRFAGLPQTPVSAHSQQLLCARRVPHPQGRCPSVHLLPLQWVHGSCSE